MFSLQGDFLIHLSQNRESFLSFSYLMPFISLAYGFLFLSAFFHNVTYPKGVFGIYVFMYVLFLEKTKAVIAGELNVFPFAHKYII